MTAVRKLYMIIQHDDLAYHMSSGPPQIDHPQEMGGTYMVVQGPPSPKSITAIQPAAALHRRRDIRLD